MTESTRTNTPDDGGTRVAAPLGAGPEQLPTGFELGEEVGRGGMGVVFAARDRALDREVAVKLLQDRYAPTSVTAARFVEEARITGRLQHPGIPAVYQVGVWPDGRPFLAMKLIKGKTLDTLLKADGPDPTRWLGPFESMCHAVGYAHDRGVIHRDLKLHNVMVGRFGEVQVMDWGLAKVLGAGGERAQVAADERTLAASAIESPRSDGSETQAGSVLGTPAYMPPEQAAGEVEKIDRRSDVFGLGAVLCALLTGKPAYTAETADALRVAAVRGDTADAFRRLDACGADSDVIALCKRCLAFAPADRPADANAVATEVARIRAAADDRARRAEQERLATEVRGAEQAKRRRALLFAAGALAAVLVVGIAGTTWGLIRARQSAAAESTARQTAEEEGRKAEEARRAAEAAERETRAQLARTAATAADLATRRGAWEEAVRQYDTALALGADDPVRLKVGRVFANIALNQFRPAIAELNELAAAPDLGPHRGRVLLLQADYSMLFGRDGSTPPEEYARQARAAGGLSPADDAYARIYEAKTVPEALDFAKEALRHDPDHIQALNLTCSLAWLIGRRADARDAHNRLRLLLPNSSYTAASGAYLAAMDGDRDAVRRHLAAFNTGDAKKVADVFRLILESICDLQDENALITGLPVDRQVKLMSGLSSLTGLSELAGRSGDERPLAEMYMFRLPMFRAMGKLPAFQKFDLNNPLTAVTTLFDKGALIDALRGATDAVPDGAMLYQYANLLKSAGRWAEAAGVLRRALDATSFANHRKACLFGLMDVHWALSQKAPPREQAAWREKARADVRALAKFGPLPPQLARYASDVARDLGEVELALAFADAALARDPKNGGLLLTRAETLSLFGSLRRTERDARAALPLLAADWEARLAFFVLDRVLSVRVRDDWEAVALGEFLVAEGTNRFGEYDYRVVSARLSLARAHLRNGNFDAALPHFAAYLAQARRNAAGKPDRLVWSLRAAGSDLLRYGRHADAVPILRECLAAAEADAKGGKKFEPEVAADARRLLGLALYPTAPAEAAKLLTEAHPVLAASCARLESGRPVTIMVLRDDVRQTVQALVDYHKAAGRADEVAAWRAKLPAEVAPAPRSVR